MVGLRVQAFQPEEEHISLLYRARPFDVIWLHGTCPKKLMDEQSHQNVSLTIMCLSHREAFPRAGEQRWKLEPLRLGAGNCSSQQ